ncbi:zonular occludens toxin family protein [Lysobacteraceae bacterium NML07-0707]|nr:zonular occludens toxin family protein [Xanthomonadaceae bacterium NML07-0707]
MIYWYTGQPGHGKTLHGIKRALEFKAQGRMVYVCNVRDFDYEKSGMLKMTPEDFRNWMEFLPDGAVALVDECYEHDMLPKRPPSARVPLHVEQLAKHRHRGLDFIFICQSPDKQCDIFVHDLIERHIHVRRRFGTQFVHLRTFDRYEKNPEKATPLTIKRVRLPKEVFGLYKSTELDTVERRIPWYFIAFVLGVPTALGFFWWRLGGMGERLGGGEVAALQAGQGGAPGEHTERSDGGDTREPAAAVMSAADYLARFTPRIPSQPWSAPIYDDLTVPPEAPRVMCMSSSAGLRADGVYRGESCTCMTEQGTRYEMGDDLCRHIARWGQYEPFRDEGQQERAGARATVETNWRAIDRINGDRGVSAVGGGQSQSAVVVPGAEHAPDYGRLGI